MAPRVQPVDEQTVAADVRERFAVAEQRGAPNSTLLRILANNPHAMKMFYDSWGQIFYDGMVDHGLKEIVRVRMARLRGCDY
jgi:alkylhydroperoxidase family enzyme